jgi:hypothetical protein
MIRNMCGRCSALFALALVCLAASLQEYPVKAVRDYPAAVRRSGLAVAAIRVADQEDQRKYFGINLRSRGYLPVLLVIGNETTDASYLLNKEELKYKLGGRSRALSPAPSKASGADKVVAVAGNVPSVYTFMARLAASKSKELRQHLLRSELQSATLSPGVSAHGFIFVPVHGNYPTPHQISLTIQFLRSGTQEVVTIDLTI